MHPPSTGGDATPLAGVKHVILVMSGKGGVGKSTVATQLALGIRAAGHRVGILDIDLCGPSIPRMLGLEGKDVHQCPQGWVPVYADQQQTLAVMSIGFLLTDRDEAVVWRGPKKTAMIKQFVTDVAWQDVDYLLIDTPPGTSDEHIAILESLRQLRCDGAVLVTTPQNLAVGDVRRQVTFCRRTGLKVLGIVENMSGFVCPNCSECTNIFSSGGGEQLSSVAGVPFLGRLPLEPRLAAALDAGAPLTEAAPAAGPVADAVSEIVRGLLQTVR
ncbi:Cytosolic Fe-S cluster assembly factor nubp2 [Amphibalanus amphitrite]|uniref:Cytosolic Fe-S cluster assembly factor NUBP2 homolog n=1 Tax=Amphibalanus amphitrite TaxID=1232801 RepID=A0A6A4VI96_AMPAM|nr:Cytosolic Fe-S cluster assembly factor nubp2 [Amphibalanus amphitrite]